MIAVVIDQVKPKGLEVQSNLLLNHVEATVPEGYVTEEVFWEEFDRKLLASYGKV